MADQYESSYFGEQVDEAVGAIRGAAPAKAYAVDADTIPLSDSEDSGTPKKITWTNIKAALKTYFDTLYVTLTSIANNLTTDEEGYVLDARQGKALGDLISTVLPESGTFTPKIEGDGTPGAHTYSIQEGRYYKIGKLCFIDLVVTLTAKDAAMAGNAIITGLPFVSAASANYRTGLSVGRMANVSLPSASFTQFAAMVPPGNARIFFVPIGSNQIATTLQAAQINATSDIRLSGVYEIV